MCTKSTGYIKKLESATRQDVDQSERSCKNASDSEVLFAVKSPRESIIDVTVILPHTPWDNVTSLETEVTQLAARDF